MGRGDNGSLKRKTKVPKDDLTRLSRPQIKGKNLSPVKSGEFLGAWVAPKVMQLVSCSI